MLSVNTIINACCHAACVWLISVIPSKILVTISSTTATAAIVLLAIGSRFSLPLMWASLSLMGILGPVVGCLYVYLQERTPLDGKRVGVIVFCCSLSRILTPLITGHFVVIFPDVVPIISASCLCCLMAMLLTLETSFHYFKRRDYTRI